MRSTHKSLKPVAWLVVASMIGLAGCGNSISARPAAGGKGVFPLSVTRCGKTMTFDHSPHVLVEETHAAAIVAAAGGNKTGKVIAIGDDGNQPLGPDGATLANVPRISPSVLSD